MATITPVETVIANGYAKRVLWETMTTTNSTGVAISSTEFADRSVQVLGTFSTGGEITIQGSNDGGTTWATLTDPQGNALTITAAKIEAITECTEMLRPIVSGGDGSTDLDVYIVVRRNV